MALKDMDFQWFAEKEFRRTYNRDPHDDQELQEWMQVLIDYMETESEQLKRLLQPGSFLGDFFDAVWPRDGTRQNIPVEAAERLLRKWFTRRAVIHHERWRILEPLFWERFEGYKADRAWKETVLPAFYLATDTLFKMSETDVPLPALYQKLRTEGRKEVERDLCGGRTLDAAHEERLSEDHEVAQLEAEYRAELAELKSVLGSLPEVDLRILLAAWGEGADLSAELGMKPETVRVRRHRLREKLRRMLT